jgi:hypothetical protein
MLPLLGGILVSKKVSYKFCTRLLLVVNQRLGFYENLF